MADDVTMSSFVPPAAPDRVSGVGQRHTAMNQETFQRRLQKKDEDEAHNEHEHSSRRGHQEEQQKAEPSARMEGEDSGSDENPEKTESPGHLIDIVA